MTPPGNWPDPARPGYPRDPEKDGWHILQCKGDVGCFAWSPSMREWLEFSYDEYGPALPARADWVAEWGWAYVSPVRTDADVAAAAAQMREALCLICRTYAFNTLANSLEAIPLPHADALAAVIEKAKAEEREACAAELDAPLTVTGPLKGAAAIGIVKRACQVRIRARGAKGA